MTRILINCRTKQTNMDKKKREIIISILAGVAVGLIFLFSIFRCNDTDCLASIIIGPPVAFIMGALVFLIFFTCFKYSHSEKKPILYLTAGFILSILLSYLFTVLLKSVIDGFIGEYVMIFYYPYFFYFISNIWPAILIYPVSLLVLHIFDFKEKRFLAIFSIFVLIIVLSAGIGFKSFNNENKMDDFFSKIYAEKNEQERQKKMDEYFERERIKNETVKMAVLQNNISLCNSLKNADPDKCKYQFAIQTDSRETCDTIDIDINYKNFCVRYFDIRDINFSSCMVRNDSTCAIEVIKKTGNASLCLELPREFQFMCIWQSVNTTGDISACDLFEDRDSKISCLNIPRYR